MLITIGNTKRDVEVITTSNGNVFTKDYCVAYAYRTGKKLHISRGHVVNGMVQATWHHGSMMAPVCFADEAKSINTTTKWS